MECYTVCVLYASKEERADSGVSILKYLFLLSLCFSLSLSLSHDRECYGDGLQWGGCVIMTLLGQQKRFDALDFCYHLLRVHEFDNQDGVVQGHVSIINIYTSHSCLSQDLKAMIKRIRAFRNLNNQIMGIINKHLASSDILQRPLKEYQPPIFHSQSTNM